MQHPHTRAKARGHLPRQGLAAGAQQIAQSDLNHSAPRKLHSSVGTRGNEGVVVEELAPQELPRRSGGQ